MMNLLCLNCYYTECMNYPLETTSEEDGRLFSS